jgi:hypothetical protein
MYLCSNETESTRRHSRAAAYLHVGQATLGDLRAHDARELESFQRAPKVRDVLACICMEKLPCKMRDARSSIRFVSSHLCAGIVSPNLSNGVRDLLRPLKERREA